MSRENGILSLGHLAWNSLQLAGIHDKKNLWGNGGWALGHPKNLKCQKVTMFQIFLTISKLLASSRLKIAWITDVKIKASSAYATFGKTGMLFFF